jgi:hypothetical protein
MTLVWDRPERRLHSDRIFFTTMSFAAALIVLAGFAPSYFLRSSTLPPLTRLYEAHGLLFMSWIILFILQSALVAGGRTGIHRRLGIAGAILAAAVFTIGVTVSIETLRRGGGGADPRRFLSIPLGDIVVFGGLVVAAFLLRRKTAAHKRLMLLATISLLAAGFGRFLPQIHMQGMTNFFLCTAICVAVVMAYDFTSRGRVHPATLSGGLAVAVFKPALYLFAATPAWLAFASTLR